MDVIDIAMRVLREAGLPTLCVIFLIYFIWRTGVNARDAIIWSGPKFLLPIRDGFIENIRVLTQFVMRADELLPEISQEQCRITEKIETVAEKQARIAEDSDSIKKMQKAFSIVISHQCEAADCWFKRNRKEFASDLFDSIQEKAKENKPQTKD